MVYKDKISVVIKWYRVERWLFEHKLIFMAKMVYHMIQIIFGCTIPYSTRLEKGVNIAHFHGIVLHQGSAVGENTIIYQNVCLGGVKGQGGPTIGKNCVIGAGACVLGNIKIGDNVKIGANAVVLQDVPDGCTVVGVPGKIVKRVKQVKREDRR